MEQNIEKIGAEMVLNLWPEEGWEDENIDEFGKVGDTFTGKIKKDPDCPSPHLELRRRIL